MSQFNLEPIVKELTTQEKVYYKIKQSILNGIVDQEAIFTELKLADSLNTSRTPVRAALQDLANEGLIVQIPRKGFKVRNFTEKEQEEIFLLRTSIETQVIQKVAEVITSKQIVALKEILKEQEKAMLEEKVVEFIDLDQSFHNYLVEVGQFNIIKQILLNLQELSKLIGLKALSYKGRMQKVWEEHQEIIASLEKHDPQFASETMFKHLKSTSQTLKMIDKPVKNK